MYFAIRITMCKLQLNSYYGKTLYYTLFTLSECPAMRKWKRNFFHDRKNIWKSIQNLVHAAKPNKYGNNLYHLTYAFCVLFTVIRVVFEEDWSPVVDFSAILSARIVTRQAVTTTASSWP
jgi:hypothetical protein